MTASDSKKKKIPLPIGFSDFRDLRENKCYYVDKSMFIKEITEAWGKVLLLPRPRRFGKTLNLSMLRYFYEKTDKDLSALFDGLALRNDETFRIHRGKYPVVWMTFKDVKSLGWSDCLRNLHTVIYKEYARHRYILDSNILFSEEKTYFTNILNKKADQTDYERSLEYLSVFLRRFHDKQVIILIDEYDTPINAGYIGGYYEKIINFMRNLLSGGLKDNEHLFKGVVTGVLRVAKESIFSGLNNLDVFTLLDEEFRSAFGFTEKEVQDLLKDYCLSDRYDEVSQWYNGYLFGGKVVYNPWSVLNYVASMGQAEAYWINTANTDFIDNLATRGGKELREELGQLLENGTITKPVHDNIVMRDLDTRDDLLWSFLLFSGYLRCTGEAVRRNYYELEIPNEEVRIVYEDMIEQWFAEKIGSEQLKDMLKALETGEVKMFEQMLRQVVLQVMSYHDFSGAPEKVYHALVLGMLLWMSGKYEIRSNRESGYGRYDLMLKPKNLSRQGIVIEFKKVYEGDTSENVLEEALKQIEEKKYAAELEAAGVKDILKLAVAFKGKELWVKQGK
ncbi:MAG: AAA family ATPase [Desulfobacteraceae bacterium]|nr:AAA family ATPase [Desulfobacteraceae bacterium]